jgi:hypothetical protein
MKEDIAILHHIPFNPNIGIRSNAKGIRISVNIMEIADGILGKPMPV